MSSEAVSETGEANATAKTAGVRRGRKVRQPQRARDIVVDMHNDGATLREIAKCLEGLGIRTATGKRKWHTSTVRSILNSHRLDTEVSRAAEARRRAIAARMHAEGIGRAVLKAGDAVKLAEQAHTEVGTFRDLGIRAANRAGKAAEAASETLTAAAAQVKYLESRDVAVKTAVKKCRDLLDGARATYSTLNVEAREHDIEAKRVSKSLAEAVAAAARSGWEDTPSNAVAEKQKELAIAAREAAEFRLKVKKAEAGISAAKDRLADWEKVERLVEFALQRARDLHTAAKSASDRTTASADVANQAKSAGGLAAGATERALDAYRAVSPHPD